MNPIELWHHDSMYTKPLSPACMMCAEGAKLVVLITGICPASCFYCPLSLQKGGFDGIYADEWGLADEDDTDILIKESNLIDAKGAGITGGDPLSVPDRTLRYIRLLKQTYGSSFHIHLYTSGQVNTEYIPDLAAAGLDEIRFHPLPHEWDSMESSLCLPAIKHTLETNMDVALEIPVIPFMEKKISDLLSWAESMQINWVNLNELEFSERNEQSLRRKGFCEKNDVSAAVSHSQETAYSIINDSSQSDLALGIHYCSASFKDGIQLRNRLHRRARNIATPLDIITDDSTLLKGFVQCLNHHQLHQLVAYVTSTYHLLASQYDSDMKRNRLQLPIPLLQEIAESLKKKGFYCYISELYPTHDQLEVERIPLPFS